MQNRLRNRLSLVRMNAAGSDSKAMAAALPVPVFRGCSLRYEARGDAVLVVLRFQAVVCACEQQPAAATEST